jgi:hypothetical protein
MRQRQPSEMPFWSRLALSSEKVRLGMDETAIGSSLPACD